jgi:GDP-L-fucose synthase
VIPALIKRFHEAKAAGLPSVTIWGSGTPLREFLYVDDLADACVHLLKVYSDELHINVGSGAEISIGELARQIANVCGYEGEIVFDRTKPDGTPRKLMDTTRLRATGWAPQTSLEAGLKLAYADFLQASSVL